MDAMCSREAAAIPSRCTVDGYKGDWKKICLKKSNMEVGGCIQKSMVFVASAQCQMYFLMLE